MQSSARYTPKRYQAAPTHADRTSQFLQAVVVASLVTCLPIFFGIYLLTSQQINQPQTRVASASYSQPEPTDTQPNARVFITPTSSPVQDPPTAPTPTQTSRLEITSSPLPTSIATPTPTIQTLSTNQNSCTDIPFPDNQPSSSIINRFQTNWHITLQNGSQDWSDSAYHQLLSIWWQTIDQLACTPFLASALGGHTLTITANDLGIWWGQYDGGYQQEINIANQNKSLSQPSHIQQNIVHELAHVWRDTHFDDTYQTFANQLCGNGNPNAYITNYGATNCSEDLSEAVGYYVIRQATEWQTNSPYCAAKNPYDWGQAAAYDWIKTNLFNGQQFGPPPPTTPTSC